MLFIYIFYTARLLRVRMHRMYVWAPNHSKHSGIHSTRTQYMDYVQCQHHFAQLSTLCIYNIYKSKWKIMMQNHSLGLCPSVVYRRRENMYIQCVLEAACLGCLDIAVVTIIIIRTTVSITIQMFAMEISLPPDLNCGFGRWVRNWFEPVLCVFSQIGRKRAKNHF